MFESAQLGHKIDKLTLVDNGAIVCKFWLQTSRAEQLKRFKLREKTSFKHL